MTTDHHDCDVRTLLDGLGVATIAEAKRLVDHGRAVVQLADDTLRAAGVDPATLEPLEGPRDATAAELLQEPDGVLQSIVEGDLDATDQTRHLAQAELDHRRARASR